MQERTQRTSNIKGNKQSLVFLKHKSKTALTAHIRHKLEETQKQKDLDLARRQHDAKDLYNSRQNSLIERQLGEQLHKSNLRQSYQDRNRNSVKVTEYNS